MRRELAGKKLSALYRHSIFIVHPGRDPMLEAVYDKPASLRRALQAMRQMNPHRVYVTDDPSNP